MSTTSRGRIAVGLASMATALAAAGQGSLWPSRSPTRRSRRTARCRCSRVGGKKHTPQVSQLAWMNGVMFHHAPAWV